jgi:hypothetical protein
MLQNTSMLRLHRDLITKKNLFDDENLLEMGKPGGMLIGEEVFWRFWLLVIYYANLMGWGF